MDLYFRSFHPFNLTRIKLQHNNTQQPYIYMDFLVNIILYLTIAISRQARGHQS